MADEEKKPNTDQLEMTVKDQHGGEVKFKVKRTTKFEKVFIAYAAKKQVAHGTMRFTFDGKRLNGNSTPAEVEMEDQDIVEAMVEQTGGRAS